MIIRADAVRTLAGLGLALAALFGCRGAPRDDTAFAGVQARGATAMGVDQYTSSHVFEPLPDGGRIVLQRDAADSTGTAVIREHMGRIAAAFAAGDFRLPGFVHAQEVPGTATMAARRGAITYTADTLPRGGEVRIHTADPEAVRAVHEFLAFQRADHRAGAHLHDTAGAAGPQR
jgi:hypothetical protein